MKKMLRFAAVALGLAAPVMALGASPGQMESFYECVLPPTLAVYQDATIASGHISNDMSFYKNKHPGASFNEASWLYALYAKKNLTRCKMPTGQKDKETALSVIREAGKIINGYIHFTWSPTRVKLGIVWPDIHSGYEKIRAITGNRYSGMKIPSGVITTDGKYDAMINMQRAQAQSVQNN